MLVQTFTFTFTCTYFPPCSGSKRELTEFEFTVYLQEKSNAPEVIIFGLE